jgi:TonB family protein
MAEINAQWVKDHPQGDDPVPERMGNQTPLRLPQEALDAGVEGELYSVQANVDEHGQVTHVKLLRTSPPPAYPMDEAVIAYVKQCKFRPAVRAGKPIAAAISFDVDIQ